MSWTLAAALCAAAATVHSLPGQFITVAWDSSADERVAGYAVFVGTASRNYNELFLVRNRTYFTYADAVPERRYYFSVVAYTDALISDLSQEVSGVGQSTPALPVFSDFAQQNPPNTISPLESSRPLTCTALGRAGCSGASILGVTGAVVDAVAAAGDGRLMIVENGQRVRIFDGRAWSRDAALVAPSDVTFLGVAVDPRPGQQFVYVAEAERRADGTRDLRIVRYRAVQNTLGEPAAIVAGIRLPATGSAPFTVDPDGRIFVAVPSLDPGTGGSAGVVLGFESDGSVFRNNRAFSPVVGYTTFAPASIAWDNGALLWLTGLRGTQLTVVRLPTAPLAAADPWPREPYALASVSSGGLSQALAQPSVSDAAPSVFVRMAAGGRVVQVSPGGDEFSEDSTQADQQITAVATDRESRSTYTVVRSNRESVTYIYKTRD